MPRSALEELQHLKALLAATDAPDSRRTSASSQVSPDIIAAQVSCQFYSQTQNLRLLAVETHKAYLLQGR